MQIHTNEPSSDADQPGEDLNQSFNPEEPAPDESTSKSDSAFQNFIASTRVLKDATLFRLTGSPEAGERLIEALSSQSEDARLVAGMGLVAGGQNAVPLIVEALSTEGPQLRMVIDIAASLMESEIGVEELKAALEPLRNHQDPSIASEAKEILEDY